MQIKILFSFYYVIKFLYINLFEKIFYNKKVKTFNHTKLQLMFIFLSDPEFYLSVDIIKK